MLACAHNIIEILQPMLSLLRAQGQPQIRGMTCSTNAYGITADFRLHNKAVKGWEFSKVRRCACASSAASLKRFNINPIPSCVLSGVLVTRCAAGCSTGLCSKVIRAVNFCSHICVSSADSL